MCRYNTLYRSKHGYIIQCRNSDTLQVAFGTTSLSLSAGEFDEFMAVKDNAYREYWDYRFPDQKAILMPTKSAAAHIVCSLNELTDIRTMLKQGKNKLELAKLFIFHEN